MKNLYVGVGFDHQTEHLLDGFIGSIGSQWNAFANSGELDKDPMTRYLPGV